MQAIYRVVVFGEPRGPWREQRRHACHDAMDMGMGEYDVVGNFFVTVPAAIQCVYREEIKVSA